MRPADTVSAANIGNILHDAGITVIGLTPTGLGTITCVKTLADITGGTLQATTDTGALIMQAILAGIGELTTDVWWSVTVPDPDLIIELTPTMYPDMTGNQTVTFNETVTVSQSAAPGAHHAEVSFYENGYPVPGTLYGVQQIDITVVNPCTAVAPSFSICTGTTVNDQLFISNGAHCTGGCTMVISQNVNSNLPGTYNYTVFCYQDGTLRSQADGIVTVVGPCTAAAPNFSICTGTTVNDQLFISQGASCSQGCTMSISNNINNAVPGTYQYTVTCTNGVCTPVQVTGNVTVLAPCTATAPDFSICTGTIINNDLFTIHGAACSQGCTMSITHNINNTVPGTYQYTVTCTNGVCTPAEATGNVTVLGPCAALAPDFTICAGTLVNDQLFIDNGASCSQGCNMTITNNINPSVAGTYQYTVFCTNSICPLVQVSGTVTVLAGCTATAPDFSICTGTVINDQLFVDHGACSQGCTMSISQSVNGSVPGSYQYTVTCENGECPPVQARGTVTVVAACTVAAPNFSICVNTTVNTQMFLDHGVVCSEGCQISIQQSINSGVIGQYPYTVNCSNGVCAPVQASGIVTVVPTCVVEAPDFHICQFTPITFKLFTDHGAYCSEECCMEIVRDQVNSSIPGVYEYTVICSSCEGQVCPPVSAMGHIYVDELCVPTAPDFSVCRGTVLTDQLFLDHGVDCSQYCSLSINYTQVNTAVPGLYPYIVTCTNPCGPVSIQGMVTVCTDITGIAPTVTVCEGYTLNDLRNAIIAAGGGCNDGGCPLSVDSIIDNGDGTYTLICENDCDCVIEQGEIIVCHAPVAFAPPVEVCEGYSQSDLETAVTAAGGGADCGACECTLQIITDNHNGTYTIVCVNQCGCDVDTGDILIQACDNDPYQLNLVAGWNLISFPVYIEESDRDPYIQFGSIIGALEAVYAFDACVAPPSQWTTFVPGGPSVLNSISDGWGYWVLMNAPATLSITGEQFPEPPTTPPSYSLCTGWNLIGVRSATPILVSDYLSSIQGKWAVIYGYDGSTYFTVPNTGYLMPGFGYWIAMTEPGIVQH